MGFNPRNLERTFGQRCIADSYACFTNSHENVFYKVILSHLLAPKVFDCALPHLNLIHRRERGENRASAFVFVSSFSQWPSTERADGDYRLVIPPFGSCESIVSIVGISSTP